MQMCLTNDGRGTSTGCKHAENACAASNIQDSLALEELSIGHYGIPVGLCASLHMGAHLRLMLTLELMRESWQTTACDCVPTPCCRAWKLMTKYS